MTIIDLKKSLGIGGNASWSIAETQHRTWPASPTPVEKDGAVYIDRRYVHNLTAAMYPEFYTATDGVWGNPLFSDRTPTASPSATNVVQGVDTKGTYVVTTLWNTTGNVPTVNVSGDDGSTFSPVSVTTSPAASRLRNVHYNAVLDKWFIFYSSTRVLISTNGNATAFTDTAITGFGNTFVGAFSNQCRVFSLGSTLIFASLGGVWTSTNGTTWTDRSSSVGNGGGKLTTGNGYAVLLTPNFTVYTTQNGTTWTNQGTLVTSESVSTAYVEQYGVVFTGTRWIVGLGGNKVEYIDSGIPYSNPAPTNYVTVPTRTHHYFAYTTGAVPSGFINKSRTIAEHQSNAWSNADNAFWKVNYGSNGVKVGPITSLGAFYKKDYANGSGIMDLYGVGFWEAKIAESPAIVENTNGFSSIYVLDSTRTSTSGEALYGITSTNSMWFRSLTPSGLRLSGSTIPNISVPIGTHALNATTYGNPFTRIA